MGENPLISDGKRRPSSLMEKTDNLLESFDAEVKYSQHKPPTPPNQLRELSRHFESY